MADKYFFDYWPNFCDWLQGRELLLFLDYDGTLTPIAPTPPEALLPPENRELLEKLCATRHIHAAVVSGRSIADLKQMIGLKNLIYVGNHGLEIEGPGIRFTGLIPPPVREAFIHLKQGLEKDLTGIPGIFYEDKQLTISVHYRLMDEKDLPELEKIMDRHCRPLEREGKVRRSTGKKVFEVRPPIEWNKGFAVSWIVKEYKHIEVAPVMPVYFGDDLTDEDAFRHLKTHGWTVLVGERETDAEYFVKDTADVTRFLEGLVQLAGSQGQTRRSA